MGLTTEEARRELQDRTRGLSVDGLRAWLYWEIGFTDGKAGQVRGELERRGVDAQPAQIPGVAAAKRWAKWRRQK